MGLIRRRSADLPAPVRMPLGANIALVLTVAVLFTFTLGIVLWWGIGEPTIANRPWTAKDGFDFIKIVLTVVGGVGGVVALVVSYRKQRLGESADAREDSRLFGEDFSKATEQIGSPEAPVRLAGMYILERLAQSTPKQQQTIISVLCAYLRMPYVSPDPTENIVDIDRSAIVGVGTTREAASAGSDYDHEQKVERLKQEREVRLTAQRIIIAHLNPGIEQKKPNNEFWGGIHLDFTGATLIDFSLNDCYIYSATFDRARFEGNATFIGARFQADCSFSGASFVGRADFGESVFGGTLIFDGAQFSNRANFSSASTKGRASFAAATFEHLARFEECNFDAGINLEGAQFDQQALFVKSRFGGNCILSRVNFSAQAKFGEARFCGDASFDGARFKKFARFDHAEFFGHTSLVEASFSDPTYFGGAKFGYVTNFDGVQFDGKAFFMNSEFDGDAIFTRMHAEELAMFVEAIFNGHARFDSGRFRGGAWFQDAHFIGAAGFADVGFAEASFTRVKFGGSVSFSRARLPIGVFSNADTRVRVDVPETVNRIWPNRCFVAIPDSANEKRITGHEGEWGRLMEQQR